MQKKIFFFCFLMPLFVFSQKCENKSKKQIYTSVLKNYLEEYSGRTVVIADSILNRSIVSTKYYSEVFPQPREMAYIIRKVKLDSSWIPTLINADVKKAKLKEMKFPSVRLFGDKIKTINKIQLSEALSSPGGWFEFKSKSGAGNYLIFSDILLIKNRAIVELSSQSHELSASTRIYFLEKRKKKWVIISFLETSIS